MDRPIVLSLARDVVLTSARNGAEAIYWMPASDWERCPGARGLRIVTTIAEITASTQVKIYAQYSYDQKTWADFARNLDGLTNGYTATGTFSSTYADSPTEFGPYVRLGIQVKQTGSQQAQVRLTSTALVLFSNVTSVYGVLSGSTALSVNATPTALGSSFDASMYDEGQIIIAYSGTPTTLQFSVWVSPDGGTTWGKAGEAAAVSAAPNSGEGIYIALPYLGSTMQVRYTMAGGTSINCTGIQFIGRVN